MCVNNCMFKQVHSKYLGNLSLTTIKNGQFNNFHGILMHFIKGLVRLGELCRIKAHQV